MNNHVMYARCLATASGFRVYNVIHEKYSTVFAFDPPTQNSLYIYIYISHSIYVKLLTYS